MSASSRIPSRTTTLLAVAAAHALVLWAFLTAAPPQTEEAETFTSILLWSTPIQRDAVPQSPHPQPASRVKRVLPSPSPAPITESTDSAARTAITAPVVPGAEVDWSGALTGAANATLEKEKKARDQLNASLRKYTLEPDPLNPGRSITRDFRWSDAGTHRIDTRGPLPGLWVNDRCVLIAFIIPACMIGHIDIHDDLFQNMAKSLDERAATARPNDAP